MIATLPMVIANQKLSKLLYFVSSKEDLIRLQETAEMVQALFFYASVKYDIGSDESVRIWLKKFITVANYADAALEVFNYETLRFKLEINGKMDKVGEEDDTDGRSFKFVVQLKELLLNVEMSIVMGKLKVAGTDGPNGLK